jgi:hypothetical protein
MRKFILVLAFVFVAGLLLVGAARALGFPFPWIETPNTGGYNPNQPYATPPPGGAGAAVTPDKAAGTPAIEYYLPVIRSPN